MGLHLEETDARKLTRNIVAELQKMGGHVEDFGVHLEREGFYFLARVNGRTVWARTGQGGFSYRAVAAELLGEALKAQDTPWVASDAADAVLVN